MRAIRTLKNIVALGLLLGTIGTIGTLITVAATAGDRPDWRKAAPGYQWSFPRDLYSHPQYKTEWWYITGHLQTTGPQAGEALAFQLTFFRVGIMPAGADTSGSAWNTTDLIMAHAAVTDPQAGGHVFSETIWRATPFLGGFGAPGDTNLVWCQAPVGTDDRWRLDYRDGAYELHVRDDKLQLQYDLICTPTRQPVFHGAGGFSPKTPDLSSGSLYFSQPRMAVAGTVRRGDEVLTVEGESWLDREIFTSTLGTGQKGWDWLALQLDDGRELMLYRLLDTDGKTDYALGTLVDRDGTTTTLPRDQWQFTPQETWTSPETETTYPTSWRLQVPSAQLDLDLKALLPDQENTSLRTGIHYWEGAVRATEHGTSRSSGRGFVEMTGYGPGSRPPV